MSFSPSFLSAARYALPKVPLLLSSAMLGHHMYGLGREILNNKDASDNRSKTPKPIKDRIQVNHTKLSDAVARAKVKIDNIPPAASDA
jgi:hypothetical protein